MGKIPPSFSPFETGHGGVTGTVVKSETDLADLPITLFADGDLDFTPAPDHALWLDADRTPHYDPSGAAEKALRAAAIGFCDQAKRSLARNRLKEAYDLSAQARAAFGGYLEGYVIAAAVHRLKSDPAKVALMRQLASRFDSESGFESRVSELVRMARPPKSPLANVAKQEPCYPSPNRVSSRKRELAVA